MSLLLLLSGGGTLPAPPADGVPSLTIEMAFGHTWQDPNPTWTDVSAYALDALTIDRGRSRELDTFQTGTASFTLINDDRRFDPFHAAGPYYGDLKPNVPVRIRATWQATYTLFRGFVDGWPQTYTPADVTAYVQINCSDAFKLLTALDLNQQTFTFDDPERGFDVGRFAGGGLTEEQLSGERIDALLDMAGWPDELREIDPGATVVQSQDTEGSALDAMQLVERSEDGYLYVEADGDVTFVDRYGVDTHLRMSTVQATFTDAGGYEDITYPYDDQLIYNDVRRQREGGVEQRAEDTTSIGEFFRKPHSETGLLMNSDAVALGLAQVFLERHKDPQRRIDGLIVNPDNDPTTQWAEVFGLRVLDRITVSRTPQQIGSAITGDYLIQGMSHRWAGLGWSTTYYVTPADDFEFFLFDDATRGFDSAAVFAP